MATETDNPPPAEPYIPRPPHAPEKKATFLAVTFSVQVAIRCNCGTARVGIVQTGHPWRCPDCATAHAIDAVSVDTKPDGEYAVQARVLSRTPEGEA